MYLHTFAYRSPRNVRRLIIDFGTGAMELIAPGDRVRAVGGKLNGSQNGYSLLGSVSFPNTFSLLITLRVQPKVSVLIQL